MLGGLWRGRGAQSESPSGTDVGAEAPDYAQAREDEDVARARGDAEGAQPPHHGLLLAVHLPPVRDEARV